MKKISKISINDKLSKFSDHWSPKIITEINDYQFKLVKIKDDFEWHSHNDTDEAFIVIKGSMRIDFKHDSISLSDGEMVVVPKGVEHKPYAQKECSVMIIEPRGVTNTGEKKTSLTAENDVWI